MAEDGETPVVETPEEKVRSAPYGRCLSSPNHPAA